MIAGARSGEPVGKLSRVSQYRVPWIDVSLNVWLVNGPNVRAPENCPRMVPIGLSN